MVYAALSSRSSQESRLGSNRIEYPTALSDIAYELLLAKENPLTHLDELAAQKYSEALDVYMAAKDVWEISDKLKECEARTSDSKFCLSLHGASAAERAQINVNRITEFADAVQMAWQVAKQKADQAENIRRGR
jgi:hypothetical protein